MSSYESVEWAVLPQLTSVPLSNRLMSQRVLRSALVAAPLEYLEQGSSTMSVRSLWIARARKEHDREYGFSILTAILVSILIKVAVGLLLEWWLNRATRETLVEAVREARGNQEV